MNHRWLIFFVTTCGLATWTGAAPETQPATTQPDSPKGALKAQDAVAKSGDVQADLAFYRAEGDQLNKLAHAIAEADVALAKLEKAVDSKFGNELAAAVVRAAGSEAGSAVDAASETLEGDRATVQFKDQAASVPMVRADGKWKISLADWVKGATAEQVEHLTASVQKMTGELNRLDGLVEKDKFRSGEGVRDRVQGMHDQLFGGSR